MNEIHKSLELLADELNVLKKKFDIMFLAVKKQEEINDLFFNFIKEKEEKDNE